MHRGLPGLRDAERFGPWIYRVVRNAITDRYRAQAREASPTGDLDAPDDVEGDGAEVTEVLATCIAPFVARLPSPYREAVTLVDLEGVAHKDAARMLGISVPGVKSRVQRGRRRLRAMFDECCRLELDARRRVVGYECVPGKDPRCGGGCG
jgi:RNA polymerase sigma-70 factor (ECF subfamily)